MGELGKPPRAGIAWTPEEDRKLLLAFDQGATIAAPAQKHERTRGAIESHLVKHGRMNRDSDEFAGGSRTTTATNGIGGTKLSGSLC